LKKNLAIGDIHGCISTFKWMLFVELKIQKQDEIYCIGDYIDRGSGSKEVVDIILLLREQGYQINTLRGNHEQIMMESTESFDNLNLWLKNGGDDTLKSFGINSYADMPHKYKQFFSDTKFYIATPDYIFVHAGLNFQKPDIFEDKEAMLWTRNFNPQQPILGNKILVHGHTPQSLEFILNQKTNCLNIDGGCVYKTHPQLGNLVALNLIERKFSMVKCMD